VLLQTIRGFCLLLCAALAAPVLHGATFEELAARASAARESDQVPQAIDLYQQALQLKPDWSEGWFYLGTLYYDSDRYPDAQQSFSHFVQLRDTPGGWAFLGLCEFETGAYPAAQEHLRQAVERGVPAEIDQVARLHEALLLTRMGLFEQARHWYERLVRGGSHDPTLIAGLGLNALDRPQLPREIPADQRAMVNAAGQTVSAWLAGDPSAAAAFQTLLKAYPDAAGMHALYAAYLYAAHPEDAMAELRRELHGNPKNAEARAMLALLLLQAGKRAEAAAEAAQAVADGPASAEAQFACAQTIGDFHQAAVHLESAVRLDPANLDFHIALAHVYAEIGRDADSRRERTISIQLARQSDPRQPG